MIRKYHNHTLQTNLRHREVGHKNNNCNKTQRRQTEKSDQLSLPRQDDCKTRKDTKQGTTNYETNNELHNGSIN